MIKLVFFFGTGPSWYLKLEHNLVQYRKFELGVTLFRIFVLKFYTDVYPSNLEFTCST
jgi:hypothetical protein